MLYDNHSNDIEYINLHKKEEAKTIKEPVEQMSNESLFEKHLEIKTQFEQTAEFFTITNDKNTVERLRKLSGYLTILRIEMKKRKIKTSSKIIEEFDKREIELKKFAQFKIIVKNYAGESDYISMIDRVEEIALQD